VEKLVPREKLESLESVVDKVIRVRQECQVLMARPVRSVCKVSKETWAHLALMVCWGKMVTKVLRELSEMQVL